MTKELTVRQMKSIKKVAKNIKPLVTKKNTKIYNIYERGKELLKIFKSKLKIMTKELTVRQMASIKRVAQNVNPLVTKKNKIISKLNELREEYDSVCNEINGHEMGVISLT